MGRGGGTLASPAGMRGQRGHSLAVGSERLAALPVTFCPEQGSRAGAPSALVIIQAWLPLWLWAGGGVAWPTQEAKGQEASPGVRGWGWARIPPPAGEALGAEHVPVFYFVLLFSGRLSSDRATPLAGQLTVTEVLEALGLCRMREWRE